MIDIKSYQNYSTDPIQSPVEYLNSTAIQVSYFLELLLAKYLGAALAPSLGR